MQLDNKRVVALILYRNCPYKNLLFDVGMLFLNPFDLALFLVLFDYLHGVHFVILFFPDQDDFGVVTDADLAEHIEIVEAGLGLQFLLHHFLLFFIQSIPIH